MLGWMAALDTSPARPWHVRLLLGVLLATLVGCTLDNHPVVYVKNDAGFPVEVVLAHDSGEESVVDLELPPGAAVTYDRMADCVDGVLIARDSAGQEVARSPRPVCRPSEWVITSSPTP